MESRRLELSDLASEQEIEIKKNPYQFLDLPLGTSSEEVRKSYHRLAKLYHPDLVGQKWTSERVGTLYSQRDLESLKAGISLDELMLAVSNMEKHSEKVASAISQSFKNPGKKLEIPDTSPEVKKHYEKASEILASLATRKMTLLNRAYYEIKARANPKEWNRLFGYESESVFDDKQGKIDLIKLDGRGDLWIFPKEDDFFVRGAYLDFDFGPDDDHSWEEWGYRHSLCLKHLFAHMERNEGKKINKNLLNPLTNCFSFDEKQAESLIDLLSKKEIATHEVMKKMEVKDASEIKNFNKQIRSIRFERQINEILFLSRGLGEVWQYEPQVKASVEDGKLILEDYTKTIFSETDYMLFLTLAYGDLIQ